MFVSKKKYNEQVNLTEFYKSLFKQQEAITHKSFQNVDTYRKALETILEQETPAPNATVTRILNIARTVLYPAPKRDVKSLPVIDVERLARTGEVVTL
jgi:hypothetical protein